jgi:hypothetical protein
MDNPLLILIGAILLAFVVGTRGGRTLLLVAIAVVICVTAYGFFVREVSCPRTDQDCFVPLQRTVLGPCSATEGAGLLRIEGTYYLTAPAGADARATCFSVVGK